MTDTLEIIVSVVGVGIVVLLALVGFAWRLSGRFERMEVRLDARLESVESRISDLGAGIRSLNQQVAAVVGLLPTAFTFLHRGKVITDEEYHETVGQFTSRISQGTESLVDYLARSSNPLTAEEPSRFRELVNKARRGEFFTRLEAQEYNALIGKVQAERPNDSNIWPLVALGAFLVGLYLGGRQDDTK